jgi:hypothetical protein
MYVTGATPVRLKLSSRRREFANWSPINLDMPALGLPKNTMPTFLGQTLLVQSEPTSQALLGEHMDNKFLRENGKTQRLVVAATEQGGFRCKLKEMARKISTLAISSWHFPK